MRKPELVDSTREFKAQTAMASGSGLSGLTSEGVESRGTSGDLEELPGGGLSREEFATGGQNLLDIATQDPRFDQVRAQFADGDDEEGDVPTNENTFVFGTFSGSPSATQHTQARVRSNPVFKKKSGGANPSASSSSAPVPPVAGNPFGSPQPSSGLPAQQPQLAQQPPMSAAAAAIAKMEEQIHAMVAQVDSTLPHGYPSVESVTTDTERLAAMIADTPYLCLETIDSKHVVAAGPWVVKISSAQLTLSAYDQLILSIAGRYYSCLPMAPADDLTARFLHICSRYGGGDQFRSQEVDVGLNAYWNELSSEGVIHLPTLASKVLLTGEAIAAPHYSDSMTLADLTKSLDEVWQVYPPIRTVYNMCYQVAHEGLKFVSPLHDAFRFNDAAAFYVDRIACGSDYIRLEHVVITPRASNLQFKQPEMPLVVPVANPPPEAATGAGDIAAQTAAATGLVSERRRNSARTGAATSGATVPGSGTGASLAAVNQDPAQPTPADPHSLLNQGLPARQPPVRDTSTFRDGVVDFNGVLVKVHQLLSNQASQDAKLDLIMQRLSNIEAMVDGVDKAFAAVITRHSRQDLTHRQTVNSTLLQPSSSEAQNLASGSTPPAPPQTNQVLEILKILEGGHADELTLELVARLKALILETGNTRAAQNITIESIKFENARKRTVQRIKSLFHLN